MIEKSVVTGIVERWLEGREYFLVDVAVSEDNCIVVEIDHADGVWIEDCVALSKFIESNLDRDKEDFELEVGSAGLGQPFKVAQQYANHIGKQVEVMAAGKKFKGILTAVDGDEFTVVVSERKPVEGRKRPVKTDVAHTFKMSGVDYCKYVISFK
ncbi:MAG: ribosome assembly cofactor RimP [Prevotella sp.]|nr:ribosome assembly cofactor RimP [Prevotella sp.]